MLYSSIFIEFNLNFPMAIRTIYQILLPLLFLFNQVYHVSKIPCKCNRLYLFLFLLLIWRLCVEKWVVLETVICFCISILSLLYKQNNYILLYVSFLPSLIPQSPFKNVGIQPLPRFQIQVTMPKMNHFVVGFDPNTFGCHDKTSNHCFSLLHSHP
mgnify:CR=1 FL=1